MLKADFILGFLIIVGVIAFVNESNKKGANINPNSIIQKINPFVKNFKNYKECADYIALNSGNKEKLDLGNFSCSVKYSLSEITNRETAKDFSQCILNHFSNITDDNTGKSAVTKCAESSNETGIGMFFAATFDPAARVAKTLQDERNRRNAENIYGNFPFNLNRNNSTEGDGIFNLNIDGHLRPCIKVGPDLNC
jgi:hypothetical protein